MSQFPPNPYSTPTPESKVYAEPNTSFRTQFKILGIIFIVVASLGFIGGGFTLLSSVVQIASGKAIPPPTRPEMNEQAARTGFYIGFYGTMIGFGISTLMQPIILWAGINMLRLKGRGVIWTGAILATIPLLSSCCILGTPFGIWAIIILIQPASKQLIS